MEIINQSNMQETKVQKEKTQVIGCRVTIQEWDRFEKVCLENRVTMSEILKQAVRQYIERKN